MVRGFSRDYWPAGTAYPLLRTALTFLVAPMLAAAVTVLAMVLLEVVLTRRFEIGDLRSLQVAPMVLVGSYVLALSIGIVAFLALWSLRYRSRRTYALAGILSGLAFALCTPLFGLPPVGPVPVAVMAVHCAIFMLFLRAVAGVRRIADD